MHDATMFRMSKLYITMHDAGMLCINAENKKYFNGHWHEFQYPSVAHRCTYLMYDIPLLLISIV